MAYIQATNKEIHDITCKIAGLDTNYSYNDRYVEWYYNNQYKGRSHIPAKVSSGGSFKATGLTPNTRYNIDADIYWTNGLIVNLSGVATTQPIDIKLWEWQNLKTSGAGFNVTRAEWIAFCNKINEVRIAKGLSAYSFTTSTNYIDKDKPFYAWIFLQAANAINDLGTGVATEVLNVKSGDVIYSWYFENLKTALNNAIK